MKVVLSLLFSLGVVGVTLGRPEPPTQYGPPAAGGYNYDKPGGQGGDENGWDANYMFMYEVQDAASGNDFGHMEKAMGKSRTGTYHVLLPDGRMQKVDYVADEDGYRPTVTYTGEAKGYSPGVGGGAAGGGASGGSYGPPSAGAGGYRYRRAHHRL